MSLLLSGPMMKLAGAPPAGDPFTVLQTFQDSSEASVQVETGALTPSGDPLIVVVMATPSAFADPGTETLTNVTIGTAARSYGTGTSLTAIDDIVQGWVGVWAYKLDSPATSSQTIQIEFGTAAPRGVIIATLESSVITGTSLGTDSSSSDLTPDITTTEDGSYALYCHMKRGTDEGITVSGATELVNATTGGTNNFRDGTGAIAYELVPTAGAVGCTMSHTQVSNSQAWLAIELEAA